MPRSSAPNAMQMNRGFLFGLGGIGPYATAVMHNRG